LELFKLFNVRQGSKPVLIELEDHDLVMWVETVDIYLPYAILTEIKLSKLSELLQMLNLHNLIVGGVENLELFQRAIL